MFRDRKIPLLKSCLSITKLPRFGLNIWRYMRLVSIWGGSKKDLNGIYVIHIMYKCMLDLIVRSLHIQLIGSRFNSHINILQDGLNLDWKFFSIHFFSRLLLYLAMANWWKNHKTSSTRLERYKRNFLWF